MKPYDYFLLFVFTCIVILNPTIAFAEVESVRSVTKEWVAVEQAISSEHVAWIEKQALLKDLIAAAQAENKSLRAALTEIEATRSAADALRAELILQQETLQDNREVILSFLQTMEPQLKMLEKRLPSPLREKLTASYLKLSGEPSMTDPDLARRMQTVASIMTEIHEFDRTITVSNEIRKLADGSEGEVQSVYAGLGAAYYRTRSGDDAGIGYLSSEGWVWESRPKLNDEIAAVIAILDQSNREASFIDLPVILKH